MSKSDDDLLLKARKAYTKAVEWWADNKESAKSDLEFARLGKQWPDKVRETRERKRKPCEEFNKMPTFIRQVVNDSRQNKPAIKVHPQDSGADPETANVINGLIRNIETTSDADVAYDTAIEHAVGQGYGFWRINIAFASDDTFEKDIVVERIMNPFTVLGDPNSEAADSSDWNVAFVATKIPKDDFEAEYPDATRTDWDTDFHDCSDWVEGDDVVIAEWWTREKVKSKIVALSDGSTLSLKAYEQRAEELMFMGVEAVGEPRETETYKVTQRIINGAEILKTIDWPGKYIPIVPVYGDEVIDAQGKRHFRSLIRDAKGAQRSYNYMRSEGMYLLALQPRVPFVGKKGAFDVDENWSKVNQEDVPFLEYEGADAPQRQPPPQGSQAVMQEALNANDDMKSIIGIYDASLGARSNETSGRAIMARQREGDVSTFHFIDNLSRAIRHGGRILLDLIPKVYSTERMIRVLGEDMQPANVQIAPGAQQQPQQEPGMQEVPQLSGITRVFDITAGKYDLTVSAGPSYTSRREEANQMMTEMIQAYPDGAPILAPRIMKNMDMPDADKIAEEFQALNPAAQQPQVPPEVQQQMEQMQQTIQQGGEQMRQMAQENQQLKMQMASKAGDHQVKAQELTLKERELGIKEFEAQTSRMQAAATLMKPTEAPGSVTQ